MLRAVLEMLNFLVEISSLDNVIKSIEAITDEKINQDFSLIRAFIASLKQPRKEQVEALVRFFEDHQDKDKLRAELDQT